jgi:hypothetical protein
MAISDNFSSKLRMTHLKNVSGSWKPSSRCISPSHAPKKLFRRELKPYEHRDSYICAGTFEASAQHGQHPAEHRTHTSCVIDILCENGMEPVQARSELPCLAETVIHELAESLHTVYNKRLDPCRLESRVMTTSDIEWCRNTCKSSLATLQAAMKRASVAPEATLDSGVSSKRCDNVSCRTVR